MRRAWRLAPLALLAGCVDFVEVAGPALPGPQPAGASVSLQVGSRDRAAATDTIFLSAFATPGRGEDGRRRAFADDLLRVAGVPVTPEPRPDDERSYFSAFAVPAAVRAGAPLEVRMPAVAGLEPTPVLRTYLLRPLDGDTLRIAPGADLVLRLSRPPADGSPPVSASWGLTLLRDGGAASGLFSQGPVPAAIRIPADWLPPGGTPRLEVRMSVSEALLSGGQGAPYQASVTITQEFYWTVLIGG